GAPSWSPDGKFLLVAKNHTDQNRSADDGALFLIPVDGGELRPLLAPAPGRWYQYGTFSPDGRSLAFASCAVTSQTSLCDIFLVELNAGLRPQNEPRQLTSGATYLAG